MFGLRVICAHADVMEMKVSGVGLWHWRETQVRTNSLSEISNNDQQQQKGPTQESSTSPYCRC